MAFRDRIKEQLKSVTRVEGKVSKPVMFARLILLLVAALWDLMFLMVAFTLISAFSDYLDSLDITNFGSGVMVAWCLITTVLIAIVAFMRACSVFGVWERK